jgi:mono/diheme cytochrome c family protein
VAVKLPIRPLMLSGLLALLGVGVGHFSGPAFLQAQPISSPTRQRAASQDATAMTADLRAAGDLYRRQCQRCHGADGTGSPTRDDTSRVPDFTNRAWQERRSDAQLAASILEGQGTRMPAFRGEVSEQQAQDLVANIRAFGAGPAAKRVAGPPGDFGKRFRDLEGQLNELQKQFRELSPPGKKP